jgi:hypothetical protein
MFDTTDPANDSVGSITHDDYAPWTSEQEVALIEAVKTTPSNMDKNKRWKAIAIQVDGHGRRDCYVRYKASKAERKRQRQENRSISTSPLRNTASEREPPQKIKQMSAAERFAAKTWSIK